MFDELVVSGRRKKRANKWTFFFSFCVQVLLLGVLILVPLIYTEAIDLKQFSSTLLVAPPPCTPKQVAKIIEEDIPDPGGVGVIGGVPGGIPGGQAGGVLGGIIGGVGSAPPPPREAPKRIRVGGQVQAARVISQPRPSYPPLAKQARIQGVVRLQAIIAKDGTVQELQILSGHPLLVQSAQDAVRQWRYQPTLLNGEPVEVVTTIDVIFTLGG